MNDGVEDRKIMKTRIDILNKLIEENDFQRYLEIGYARGESFKAIKCKHKEAVDPVIKEKKAGLHAMTSDEFFTQYEGEPFDLVFLDGLHHCDQLRKDINNASKHLTENGVICVHDINPFDEKSQEVPLDGHHTWNGDVWRAWVGFRKKYPAIKTKAYLFDHGIGVIYPEGKKFRAHYEDTELTYAEFVSDKENLLGV